MYCKMELGGGMTLRLSCYDLVREGEMNGRVPLCIIEHIWAGGAHGVGGVKSIRYIWMSAESMISTPTPNPWISGNATLSCISRNQFASPQYGGVPPFLF